MSLEYSMHASHVTPLSHVIALIALTLTGAEPALAAQSAQQDWPTRPVRMIVPYTPGGGTDIVARILAQKMAEQTARTFVVDNRPGAGGVAGAEIVARATPDGHTLLTCATEFTTNASFGNKLPYDPYRDFAPVSLLAYVQFILAANPSVPVKSVKELIALAKARPGQLTYGSTTLGGGPHLAGELVQSMSGIRWTHVPFKGAGPAAIALMSGEIDFMLASTAALLGGVRSGKMRAIAVTGSRRFSQLPDVPTIGESGIPGYVASGWYGLLAPGGTPPALVSRINAAAGRALESADVKEKLAQNGADIVASPPQQLAEFLKNDIAKWTKVVREAGIKLQ